MLNLLWAGMLLVGLIYGCINGTITQVNTALLESAKDAVTLCLSMLGIMAFWTGLMAIARSAGIIARLERLLRPLLRLLFPGVPKDHPAGEYIVSNLIANFLGLGWAATPFGLKAMKEEITHFEYARNVLSCLFASTDAYFVGCSYSLVKLIRELWEETYYFMAKEMYNVDLKAVSL